MEVLTQRLINKITNLIRGNIRLKKVALDYITKIWIVNKFTIWNLKVKFANGLQMKFKGISKIYMV